MKIIECPRDAMQGMEVFVPTEQKIEYLNQLLQVGFDTIDFGSFVSPKAIPQMRDTATVVENLDRSKSTSKLLAIIANIRGAEQAATYAIIDYMGFPISISETFQKRNTNKSIAEALHELEAIKEICLRTGKRLVTYISMGFGNPYGDPYDAAEVLRFTEILLNLGADVISLADTIGVSTGEQITTLFTSLVKNYPSAALGVHLHSTPDTALTRIEAAYKAGCRRFDGAMLGFGGCPMAADKLTGNIATEVILDYLQKQQEKTGIDRDAFSKAMLMAGKIFTR